MRNAEQHVTRTKETLGCSLTPVLLDQAIHKGQLANRGNTSQTPADQFYALAA